MKTHKDLDVWKESIVLVEDIYRLTSRFPSEEKFGLVSQMRRAAVSLPSNIAEGAARNSSKEFLQFLYIAQGSIAELEAQIIIAEKLEFASPETISKLEQKRDYVAKLLGGLIRSIKQRHDG